MKPTCLAATLLSLIASLPLASQTRAKTYPIQAELTHSLNAASLHTGDQVVVKLLEPWQSGECILPRSSMLHGEVKQPAGTAKQPRLALLFQYQCQAGGPQKLVWFALLAPEQRAIVDTHGNPVSMQSIRSPSFGGGGGLGPSGIESRVDLSGRQNPTYPLFIDPEVDRSVPRPVAIEVGQVWKLPKLRLDVGNGPDGSTVLSSNSKDLKLPNGSVLVLMPEADALLPIPGAAAQVKHKAVMAALPKLPPLPAEIPACHNPACNPSAAADATFVPAASSQQLPLQGLGYKRLRSEELQDLEFGAAVSFLDRDHLLFTFDPRKLVARDPSDRPELRPRGIRAVLFNLRNGHVEKTFDWRVPDSAQYLWKLDDGRILVHDGNRLRWFSASMTQQRVLPLPGPLHFVRLSPDRRHYAIGTINELHRQDEHADLVRAEHGGPEEQVNIQILDENLHTEAEGVQSSRFMPPTLINSGRIDLHHARGDHWYLRETAWVKGETRDFASITSSCLPQVQSLSADLLYVEGCEVAAGHHWYQVLHEDGSPILKGSIGAREFSPLLSEDVANTAFALAIPEGGVDYLRGAVLHGADLARERVRIYNAANGRELLSATVALPSATSQPVALSAAADRLAVLDGEQILIYDIPQASTQTPLP